MSEIQLFTYEPTGDQIQTVMRDGAPWMVAAPVARALGYREASDMTRSLDEDEKGTHTVRTLGGEQRVSVISQAGLYRALAQRRAGAVKDPAMREQIEGFQRWVFHTVIPAAVRSEVRPAFRLPQTYAAALRELAATVERAEAAEEQLAVAAPAADAWHVLASAHGDYSVREAAFMLNRDPSISTGQQRLFNSLREFGLIDRRNIPYAAHEKHVRLRAGSWTHPKTGVEQPTTQVRVTFEGLRYLHRRLGGTGPFDAIAQAA